MEQKRHAMLQNYITMYMVLIVNNYMLHRIMLTTIFCFCKTACDAQAASALYLDVAHIMSHATIT